MILDQWHVDAFQDFAKPLEKLEQSFNRAGLFITFRAFVAPHELKMVDVTYKNGRRMKLICIEGDSPAQAVKDVAEGVRL